MPSGFGYSTERWQRKNRFEFSAKLTYSSFLFLVDFCLMILIPRSSLSYNPQLNEVFDDICPWLFLPLPSSKCGGNRLPGLKIVLDNQHVAKWKIHLVLTGPLNSNRACEYKTQNKMHENLGFFNPNSCIFYFIFCCFY